MCACTAVGNLIADLRPEQWQTPTPCPEWNVRDVVNQLVFGNLMFASRIGEQQLPTRGADHLGDDPVEAFWTSAQTLQAVFTCPGTIERSHRGPQGRVTGAVLLQIRIFDLLAHGWDIMQATGLRVDVPDELAERALLFAQDHLSTRRARTGRFAEPQPVDDTTSPLNRLAGFLGRSISR